MSQNLNHYLLSSALKRWEADSQFLPHMDELKEIYVNLQLNHLIRTGCFSNLITPTTLNDLSNWCMLFDQSLQSILCGDKIAVKQYIKDTVGAKYSPDCLAMSQKFDSIDIAALPEKFVIKPNHSSGVAFIVEDKAEFDFDLAKTELELSLSKKHGWQSGEWHYSCIKPLILVEEYLESPNHKSIPDFKFHVSNGIFRFCRICYGRGGNKPEEAIITPERTMLDFVLDPEFSLAKSVILPDSLLWNEMIDVAVELSKPFKMARIDMYLSTQGVKVGEITLSPMGGAYTGIGQALLGQSLIFNFHDKKPPIFRSHLIN